MRGMKATVIRNLGKVQLRSFQVVDRPCRPVEGRRRSTSGWQYGGCRTRSLPLAISPIYQHARRYSKAPGSLPSAFLGTMGRDCTGNLPLELFAAVFNLLSQPDILRCAQVSRHWRAVAATHKHYFCHLSLAGPWNCAPIEWEHRVSKFYNHLLRVVKRRVRCSLHLSIDYPLHGSETEDSDHDRSTHGPAQSWDRIWPLVQSALPRVIELRIVMSDPPKYAKDIYRHLDTPAPLLESLFLQLSCQCEFDGPDDDIDDPDGTSRALTLFANVAPRLRVVELINVPLPYDIILVFSGVSTCIYNRCDCCMYGDVRRIPPLFPSLSHLELSFIELGISSKPPDLALFGDSAFAALALRSLHVQVFIEDDVLPPGLAVFSGPVVRRIDHLTVTFGPYTEVGIEAFFPLKNVPGLLSVRVFETKDLVTVILELVKLGIDPNRRTFNFSWPPVKIAPLHTTLSLR